MDGRRGPPPWQGPRTRPGRGAPGSDGGAGGRDPRRRHADRGRDARASGGRRLTSACPYSRLFGAESAGRGPRIPDDLQTVNHPIPESLLAPPRPVGGAMVGDRFAARGDRRPSRTSAHSAPASPPTEPARPLPAAPSRRSRWWVVVWRRRRLGVVGAESHGSRRAAVARPAHRPAWRSARGGGAPAALAARPAPPPPARRPRRGRRTAPPAARRRRRP
jgi:hypothetical protein